MLPCRASILSCRVPTLLVQVVLQVVLGKHVHCVFTYSVVEGMEKGKKGPKKHRQDSNQRDLRLRPAML